MAMRPRKKILHGLFEAHVDHGFRHGPIFFDHVGLREFFAEPNNALLLVAAEDTQKYGWLPPSGAGEGGVE
jgi:hypothetical protein